ncbi:iron-containing alcohol dehydrogenase [Acerihabitans arboris]|uniref:Iron-containing alcohol dehydrogenase n=1 Tax=Acerihabitans arboris TaxID=2691583 RepID=A0A845SMA1_9GAMM|nr:iron-containing alcohol dehydrogenase [Acerihabitans arboris]NDL63698.1 iron-containing alcohol dehydrogenase [Acerihabitans arboris]
MNLNITTNVLMDIGILQSYFFKNELKNTLILIDVNVVNNAIIKETLRLFKQKSVLLVDREPTVADVNAAVKQYPQTENIIAVGGGSSMDLGKAIAVTMTNGGDAGKLRGRNTVTRPGLPIIVAPTIPGTAAEFSASVVLNGDGYKLGIHSPYLRPEVALVDPHFFASLKADIGIPVLLDGYIHSIECLQGIIGTETSRASCRNVVAIFNEIVKSGYHPEDIKWCQLAYYANYISAFSLLGGSLGAVHALSYGVSNAMGICHSKANLAALEQLMEFYGKYTQTAFTFCSQHEVDYTLNITGAVDRQRILTVMNATRDCSSALWTNTLGDDYSNAMSDKFIKRIIDGIR